MLIDVEGRECTKCGVYKPYSDFSLKSSRFARGKENPQPHQLLQPRCKPCAKEDVNMWRKEQSSERLKDLYFRRQYGMGLDEFQTRLTRQNYSCKICARPLALHHGTGDSVVVDHDHVTGHVRGLLCNECNRGLGYFRDNKNSLLKAFQYLAEHEQSSEGG